MPCSRPDREGTGWDARFQTSVQDKNAFLAAETVIKHDCILAAVKEPNGPDGLFMSPARVLPLQQPAGTLQVQESSPQHKYPPPNPVTILTFSLPLLILFPSFQNLFTVRETFCSVTNI